MNPFGLVEKRKYRSIPLFGPILTPCLFRRCVGLRLRTCIRRAVCGAARPLPESSALGRILQTERCTPYTNGEGKRTHPSPQPYLTLPYLGRVRVRVYNSTSNMHDSFRMYPLIDSCWGPKVQRCTECLSRFPRTDSFTARDIKLGRFFASQLGPVGMILDAHHTQSIQTRTRWLPS
jgi:hypothetical protein